METADDVLAHYGVLGMKWGKSKRSSALDGVSRRTNREAKKDATETARAKMYYGEGAGIRRRHISNAVKSKQRDPGYAKAYEHHLNNQDLSKAGAKARDQRKSKDRKDAIVKTTKGVKHVLDGNSHYANIAAVTIVAGATYAHKTGMDKKALAKGKEFIQSPQVQHYMAKAMQGFLKD